MACRTDMQFTVDDEGAADSSADEDTDHVLRVLGRSEVVLAV